VQFGGHWVSGARWEKTAQGPVVSRALQLADRKGLRHAPRAAARRRHQRPGDMPEISFARGDRALGDFDAEHPWELCTTLAGGAWGWKAAAPIKSLRDSVQLLVKTVAATAILSSMSGRDRTARSIRPKSAFEGNRRWLAKNGESVYATRGGPFLPGTYGVSTYRAQKIYVHVLDWKGATKLLLPAIPAKVVRTSSLTGGEATVSQTDQGVEISVQPPTRTIPTPSSCWNSISRQVASNPSPRSPTEILDAFHRNRYFCFTVGSELSSRSVKPREQAR